MKSGTGRRGWWWGVALALLIVALVAPWASSAPDGLQRTAMEAGLQAAPDSGRRAALADYATPGVTSLWGSRAVAGAAGVLAVLAAGAALGWWLKPARAAGTALAAARPGAESQP